MSNESYGVMTPVDIRLQDAVLTAIENLAIPRVKLAMKSVNASFRQSRRGMDSVVLDLNQRHFSGNIEGLQKTASSRMNSIRELKKICWDFWYYYRIGGDLLVKERHSDRQIHTHHSIVTR